MLFAPMPQELRQTTFRTGKYGALLGWGLRFADLATVGVAGVVAWWVRFGNVSVSLVYERHIAMAVLLALPVLSLSKIYRSWRGQGCLRNCLRWRARSPDLRRDDPVCRRDEDPGEPLAPVVEHVVPRHHRGGAMSRVLVRRCRSLRARAGWICARP
jgi:hypothetical protein